MRDLDSIREDILFLEEDCISLSDKLSTLPEGPERDRVGRALERKERLLLEQYALLDRAMGPRWKTPFDSLL